MKRPVQVAVDVSDRIHVVTADGQIRIYKVDPDGKMNYAFGVSGSTSVFGAKPDDMVITRTGAVCVTDRKEKKIKIYNTDGIFIRAITTADGQTPLQEPIALAADDTGALCVLDAGHKAVFRQYPRETLQRKSGDCDDLVILYAAELESVGIRPRFIEMPDHILMMFAINGTRHLGTDTMNELLVIKAISRRYRWKHPPRPLFPPHRKRLQTSVAGRIGGC